MEEAKYYVLTDINDPYENCLQYYGPFNSLKEAKEKTKEFHQHNLEQRSFEYSLIQIIKTMKG